jgi:hypothetical protein
MKTILDNNKMKVIFVRYVRLQEPRILQRRNKAKHKFSTLPSDCLIKPLRI